MRMTVERANKIPSEKYRDMAYENWVRTFIDAVVKNREYFEKTKK